MRTHLIILFTVAQVCFLLNPQNHHKITQYSAVSILQGTSKLGIDQICNYTISIGTKFVIIQLKCKNQTYKCEPVIVQKGSHFQLDQHMYYLQMQKESKENLSLIQRQGQNFIYSSVDVSLNWRYEIKVLSDKGFTLVQGHKTEYKYLMVAILGIYTFIAFIALPSKQIFYKYMEGVPALSMIVSIQLTFTLIVICFIACMNYISFMSTKISFTLVILCLVLLLCLACIVMHFIYKAKVFNSIVQGYKVSLKTKNIITLVSVVYFVAVLFGLGWSRKTWITYGYFAFGLVYYMISSILLNTIKKHRFSFRMILFDCISIMTLSICNKYYPSFNYQIPTYYQLISIILMTSFLVLAGGLMFILVKVLKGEVKGEAKTKKGKPGKEQMTATQWRSSRKIVMEADIQLNEEREVESVQNFKADD